MYTYVHFGDGVLFWRALTFDVNVNSVVSLPHVNNIRHMRRDRRVLILAFQ
jgi:hypothetical protein